MLPHIGFLSALSFGLGFLAAATIKFDWNEIVLAVVGAISAYFAYRSHKTSEVVRAEVAVVKTDVVAATGKVDVVGEEVKKTSHEFNSQMSEALKTAVAKGVLEGIAVERSRRDLEDANKAKGAEAGRKAEQELEAARQTPVLDKKP